MKNVKIILAGVAICATLFANARINALGEDSGFWPGDRDNVNWFPATINDHGFVEIDGVDGDIDGTDVNASILVGITRSSIIQISRDLNYSVEITDLSEKMLLNAVYQFRQKLY